MKEIYDKYLSAGFLVYSKIDYADYLEYLPPNRDAKILDIGCGMGQFLLFLKEKGYTDFEGIDTGKEQAEFCKELNVKQAGAISYLQGNKDYDLITMFDVIEHFTKDDIILLLGWIKNTLNDNGVLLIRTINMSNFSGMRSRYMDFTHEVGFTEESIERLLKVFFSDVKVFGNKISFKGIKRIVWLILQSIWHFIVKIMYLMEIGSDCPKIVSKYLIAAVRK